VDVTEATFRPATLDDAELAADVMTASRPDFAQDPVVTRYRWEHSRRGWPNGRFIAELDARPVAFVAWSHAPWEQISERSCYVEVWLDQARLEPALLTSLWTWITAEAEAAGGRALEAITIEDQRETMVVLDRLGYRRDRLERVWELDLIENGKRLQAEAKAARAKAAGAGIDLLTLADWRDPERFNKLHALDQVTRRDIPSTFPLPVETYENFMARANGPDRPHDRLWIARDADRAVALSYLAFPPVRGRVQTGYTCCHPDYRGRGIARAVKLQTLAQAVELGVGSVFTDNDSENAPMLHINEALGYQLRTGFVSYLKRVETS
jgi:RimJ/RimL family protein N-acetyltransferase